jgi:hypothetical protein
MGGLKSTRVIPLEVPDGFKGIVLFFLLTLEMLLITSALTLTTQQGQAQSVTG